MSRRTTSRRTRVGIAVAVVTVVVGGLAWAAFAVLGSERSITDSPLVGRAAPEVVLTKVDTDELVRIAAPGKVMVVNFWAPWCVPCLAEHEMFNRITSNWSSADVGFVGVAYQSSDGDVRAFLDRVGRNVPTLRDPEGRASIEYGVAGVPETFFVDRSGVVRARVAGPVTEALVTKVVTRLLAGEPVDDITVG